ncbi:fatty acid desaturase [Paraburkholderia xenovorans]|uniref:fatty acid desaturase family protein n=1 Tax=Paraburkholderia xenovorans TaxID=36873 RepID=UPI0038B9A22C
MSATAQLTPRPKTVQDLKSRPSSVVFSLKLAIYFIVLAHGVFFTFSEFLIIRIVGVLLIGVMFAHGVELQHQALHYHGFKSKRWNVLFGIIVGIPMLVSFSGYQDSHLKHHRMLGTKENTEFFDYGDQYGFNSFQGIRSWFIRLFMPNHYGKFFQIAIKSVCGVSIRNVNEGVAKGVRREHLWMLAFIAALTAISVALHTWVIAWVWLAPLMLVAAPVHALIEMPEHYRCDLTSTDPLLNTRTIVSNAFMTWLTNGNNYHVEHHMMPALSIDRLQDLHASIEPSIRYHHLTYREFYWAVLRDRIVPRSVDTADTDAPDAETPVEVLSHAPEQTA